MRWAFYVQVAIPMRLPDASREQSPTCRLLANIVQIHERLSCRQGLSSRIPATRRVLPAEYWQVFGRGVWLACDDGPPEHQRAESQRVNGPSLRPAQPGILPRGRHVLVVAAKPDISAIAIAEFQRLVLGNGD